jgi:hypothetical protein
VISIFRREVDENCVILGHYAASSDNLLPTFRDSLSVPFAGGKESKKLRRVALEDGTDRMSRKVGKELPLLAAKWTRRGQFSTTLIVY